MTEPTPTPVMGQVSPDGQYQWNGAGWAPRIAPAQPTKKKHTVRNVILILVTLFILVAGGCAVLVGGAANEVSKSITLDENKPGGTKNPMSIVPGKAFAVDGFNYAAGWKIGKDAIGNVEITGLKVTNNRKDRDSALVEIKFNKGTEVLALANCTTEPINVGTTVTLSCFGADKLPTDYDKITINDSF